MSVTLKFKGRRKEWRLVAGAGTTGGTKCTGSMGVTGDTSLSWKRDRHGRERVQFNQSLNQVFNLTFTDYCGTRTKKRLEIAPPSRTVQVNPKSFFNHRSPLITYTYSGHKSPLLVVDSTKAPFETKNNRNRLNTQEITRKRSATGGARMNRAWVSRKVLAMGDVEGKWMEASGHKISMTDSRMQREQERHNRSNRPDRPESGLFQVRRCRDRSRTQPVAKKIRSENTQIYRKMEPGHRTMFSKVACPGQNDSLRGWQVEVEGKVEVEGSLSGQVEADSRDN